MGHASHGEIQRASSTTPTTTKAEFDGFFGRTTFEEAVDRFLAVDQVIHGWDLARAAGLDEKITPEDVAWVSKQAEGYGARDAQPDGVRPDSKRAGASDQDKLLAYLGREP